MYSRLIAAAIPIQDSFPRGKIEPTLRMTQDAAMDDTDTLDLRGLKCPLPALLAQKALGKCAPGAVLTVLADDPLAVVDIPHMCHAQGHALEGVSEAEGYRVFTLRYGLEPGPDAPSATNG
jgi:tRNA 2-thiouridine synthesizing protein A